MNKSTEPGSRELESPAHESADLHVTGEAHYTDDIPELTGTLYCALGLSTKANALINRLDLSEVRATAGVVAVFGVDDIPGLNNCGPIAGDDPIFADGLVHCIGQPIFAVVATTMKTARRAAQLGKVDYSVQRPLLDAREAKEQGSLLVPPMCLSRGSAQQKIIDSPHRLTGRLSVGGQEQFYLEGQISYAIPLERGELKVYCSTQHPSEMQAAIAHCLGVNANQVFVEVRRMGGGFGGKESQSALFACVAALAATRLNRPVKLRLDRDDDFLATGKRHDTLYEYAVGYDHRGVILGARVEMILRGGYSTDLSPPVATRAVCHFDNAYYLSDVEIKAYCARTNSQSNTAFRGFGGPQGAFAIEYILDSIACQLGEEPLEIRRRNFYGRNSRHTTPYGQVITDNIIEPLVDELVTSAEYHSRRETISRWNAASPIIKRGMALTPVKFGIAFNLTHFNQAGALVHIYTDGSILVNHGGTEMGQGLHTKIAQIVANELGVGIECVNVSATATDKVANTSATAASTGTDLNGKAAEDAARQIKHRLFRFAAKRFNVNADQIVMAHNRVTLGEQSVTFAELIRAAYQARIQLWSDGFYATPGLQWDSQTLTGNPFQYFAYGAAVSEVAVDTLSGEWQLRRVDLLHDAGRSINPAIDIGQIEGAFIQGMGWLTTEELYWNEEGRLMTHAPSTYKIPAVNDCPADFRTRLFANHNRAPTVWQSKAVGEPPLLLAFSVFFALRDAITSVADHRINPPLQAPATPQAILSAINAVQQACRANR